MGRGRKGSYKRYYWHIILKETSVGKMGGQWEEEVKTGEDSPKFGVS